MEREITQWVHHEGSIQDPSHHERMLFHGATSRSPHEVSGHKGSIIDNAKTLAVEGSNPTET